MRGKWLLASVLLLGLMLGVVVGLSLAQGTDSEGGAAPQALVGTAFTYQGRLNKGGSPHNGICDFRFSLHDALSGGSQLGVTQTVPTVEVVDGLFTVTVNNGSEFGGSPFRGEARWLAVAVQCADDAGYTGLHPRQELTPAPYALALPGLRTEQNDTSPNVIGGYGGNSVAAGVVAATIGGGGRSGEPHQVTAKYATIGGGTGNATGDRWSTVGGGWHNTASGQYATIGGGASNIASAPSATVGGGGGNTASGYRATVGGGVGNTASGWVATVGGGEGNTASGSYTTVGGGEGNTATGLHTIVGGGAENVISTTAWYATIPGGYDNYAEGRLSFAAGTGAQALHHGTFVWADCGDDCAQPLFATPFPSTLENQFRVRATNGAEFFSDNGSFGLRVDNDDTATNGDAIRAYADSAKGNNWAAVYAINDGTSPALYANSEGTYSGYFRDNIYVEGTCDGCTLAYLALNDGDKALETGDVVAASGVASPLLGSTAPLLRVCRASEGQASSAIGVVQSRAILVESTKESESLQGPQRAQGSSAPGEYLFVVVQGIAYVKAAPSAGTIAAGQRLTAADLPGHVRPLQTRTLEGMLITEGAPMVGIALGPVDRETGLIPVLVTLR